MNQISYLNAYEYSKINYAIIKHKAWVISFWGFATENDLLSLLEM